MNNYSFIFTLDNVINSISTINNYEYENYIYQHPYVQCYFDALCELYDVLEFHPDIQNNHLINNYKLSSIRTDYFRLRNYCFSNNIENLLKIDKLPSIFNRNYRDIFNYYETIICKEYKEEKIEDFDEQEECKE